MSENHEPIAGDDNPDHGSGWSDRAGAIARAVAAVAAGVAVGVSTRDVGLGVTTAAAAVSILRELLARPDR